MANGVKSGTQSNGKELTKVGNRSKPGTTSIAYDTAKDGIGTATNVAKAVSEIYSKVGAMQDIHAASQASLMLNAIGKQLSLQSLLLRAGINKPKSEARASFFLA